MGLLSGTPTTVEPSSFVTIVRGIIIQEPAPTLMKLVTVGTPLERLLATLVG